MLKTKRLIKIRNPKPVEPVQEPAPEDILDALAISFSHLGISAYTAGNSFAVFKVATENSTTGTQEFFLNLRELTRTD